MWSLRAVVESAVEHGRRALQHAQRRKVTLVQQQQTRAPEARHKLSKWQSEGGSGVGAQGPGHVSRSCGDLTGSSLAASGVVNRLQPVANRLFQGFVRKVSSPLWTEAKKRATKRLVFGETAPYFALVGVTLVSGSQQGLVTKEDELESLCCNIREAISRAGWLHNPDFWKHSTYNEEDEDFEIIEKEHVYSLSDFRLGSIIDKGCNAVVYSAQWNTVEEEPENPPTKRQRSESPVQSEEAPSLPEGQSTVEEDINYEDLSQPIAELLEEVSREFGQQRSNSHDDLGGSSMDLDVDRLVLSSGFDPPRHVKKVKFKVVETKENAAVKRPLRMVEDESEESSEATDQEYNDDADRDQTDMEKYPLAVKMMFNYEAESNAPAILRAMYKELLPARNLQLDDEQIELQERFCNKVLRIPPHPNIVEMPCVFVDRIPLLEDSMKLYPDALPSRLNPRGYGRNMSMFCVMKRYDMSLREYVKKYELPCHTSLLLLTQLLESILHINSNRVVHRDLKSDNILISLPEGWQYPLLVLTDFGCSFVAENSSMSVPFSSREADPRQGNPALMAPEIKLAVPGLLRYISYAQSDLWAAGAIAYEIYGLENPFFPTQSTIGTKQKLLDSASYRESQLPRLPKDVPASVKHLIHDLLRRNPRNRPSANVAATLCQLVLWAPSKWLCRHALTLPSQSEIMQWLLCLATKVLCEARLSTPQQVGLKKTAQMKRGNDRQGGQLEYELVSTFLSRVHYMDIIQALKWNRAF
ncbi:serine/threonine-protein kinase Pink1, mitochondrial [Palaemon carinicauda]|uniref:serine/threonine-protein kinase Pink1, mitochondrial n=1 Tax=Palaemon carinicauda TaxID=392227 RepID=UPI0035B67220